MAEHPIIFSTEMVRAILDGRKTHTRRVPIERYRNWKVGDTLRVKESYRVCNMDVDRKKALIVHYYSDRAYESVVTTDTEMKLWKARKKPFAKTPGRFMYKSFARIFLEITNIRIERVQDISWRDCKAEGIILIGDELIFNNQKQKHSLLKTKFKRLWDSINGKRHNGIYVWDKNPWERAIEFKRVGK